MAGENDCVPCSAALAVNAKRRRRYTCVPFASCCEGQGRRASSTLASSTPYAAIATSQVRPVHALLAAAAIKAGAAHAGASQRMPGCKGGAIGATPYGHAHGFARAQHCSAERHKKFSGSPQEACSARHLRRKNAQPCSARPRGASRLARFGSIALFTVSSDADFTEGPNIDSSHPAPPAVAGWGDCSREQHGGVLGSL